MHIYYQYQQNQALLECDVLLTCNVDLKSTSSYTN